LSIKNIISVSGGKDSTALALLAIERGTQNMQFVFADTGHENALTYEYLNYLDEIFKQRCGIGITTVKSSFDKQIEEKRKYIQSRWFDDLVAGEPGKWKKKDGVRKLKDVPPAPDWIPADNSDEETQFYRWSSPIPPLTPSQARNKIERALKVLQATGNPMLDLSLWKGRFASTRRRFCSEQLKHIPITEQIINPLAEAGHTIISWQGVRRQESLARRDLLEKDVDFGSWEPEPVGILIYRPILDWSADEVFEYHRKQGVAWNPLYERGMGRVGCMPCIHAGKHEMRKIASQFPEEIDRLAQWELLVSDAAKRDCATFMDAGITAKYMNTGKRAADIRPETHGIKTYVEWATTSRGGRQVDLINVLDMTEEKEPSCSSIYGLCE
jgi:3'-phosphoadenosine 5'-phosphosulfate sulfotransferase (PAPS reductase)/FAD synthetase